jgi:hypothetical protein
MSITATYSPEDNKLRLYSAARLDSETYQRVKQAGFVWAPKQDLFVAPMWTPQREDLCLELAGEIEQEGTTLAERAQQKAERLEGLAAKRSQESSIYRNAATRVAERFAFGQPILVGHHSERKARKDQERIHSMMEKSVKAFNAVDYWNYRATGVELHANRKANAGVRARRIERYLAEMRDVQRDINHGHICKKLWEQVRDTENAETRSKAVRYYAGAQLKSGPASSFSLWSELDAGKVTEEEAIASALAMAEALIHDEKKARWINHYLNLLAYERAELGLVTRYEGELRDTILQVFARSQGVHSPIAKKTEDGFSLESFVAMPLHLSEGTEITLTDDGWRDLMEQCGYEVPAPSAAKPPILNFKAHALKTAMYGRINEYSQIEMTKEEYAKICTDYRGVRVSTCGQFRFKTVMTRREGDRNLSLYSVLIVDSKQHSAPESDAIVQISEPIGNVA